jgi:hypothetical protein
VHVDLLVEVTGSVAAADLPTESTFKIQAMEEIYAIA